MHWQVTTLLLKVERHFHHGRYAGERFDIINPNLLTFMKKKTPQIHVESTLSMHVGN